MGQVWVCERVEFSDKTKGIIYNNAGGLCQHCGTPVTRNGGEYDHTKECWEFLPDEKIDNSAANGQLLCPPCHTKKTAKKSKERVKVRRLHKKHNGTARQTKIKINNNSKLQSRPMQNSKRPIQSRGFARRPDAK